MKTIKSLLILTVLFNACLFLSCKDDDEDYTDLTLDKTTVELNEGQNASIVIASGNGNYTLEVSDKSIADAKLEETKIVITAIKEGKTNITVSDKSGQKQIIRVSVNKNPEQLTLDHTEILVNESESQTINILSGNGDYRVASDNETVATAQISGNTIVVEGLIAGSAKLTVTDKAGMEVLVAVTVLENKKIRVLVPVKLLISQTNGEDKSETSFVYDDNLRIIEIQSTGINNSALSSLLSYENNMLVKYERNSYSSGTLVHQALWSFTQKGQEISMQDEASGAPANTITINEKGQTTGYLQHYYGMWSHTLFDYDEQGNVIREYKDPLQEDGPDVATRIYEYDNRNGIYKNVNVAPWVLKLWSFDTNMSNNCTFIKQYFENSSEDAFQTLYRITYNDEGYPVRIEENQSNDSRQVTEIEYSWKRKAK